MPISLYELSIPVFIRGLTNLSAILKKGEAYADEKGIPHATLLQARLYDDMEALVYQIQRCSDSSKGAAVRVAGIEPVAMPDSETTFDDLHVRIQKTINLLKTVEAASMDGKEDAPVVLKTGSGEMSFTAQSYLLNFALPNFYFHVVTAYDILTSLFPLLVKERSMILVPGLLQGFWINLIDRIANGFKQRHMGVPLGKRDYIGGRG